MNVKKDREINDRRVRRTRRALRAALLDLMAEKGYDQVTVEEITDRADIGRTTFYLHYHAKQDLLLEQFGEMTDELVMQLSHIPLSAWWRHGEFKSVSEHPSRPISMIFQHAADNAELYRIVLQGEGADQAAERLQVILTNAVNAFIRHKIGTESEQLNVQMPMDVFANYFSGALLGVLKWWLEADMPYPPEEMESIFYRLFLPGARQVLSMDNK